MISPNVGTLETATPASTDSISVWQSEKAKKATLAAVFSAMTISGANIRITDTTNGKTYSLGSTGGVLELVEV